MFRFPKHGMNIKKNIFGLTVYGLLLAGISLIYLFFAGDIALFVAFLYRVLPVGTAVFLLAVLGGLLWRERFLWGWCKRIFSILCCLVLTFFVVIGILTSLSRLIRAPADFQITTPFFSGKTVMVFVPHQDDEINLYIMKVITSTEDNGEEMEEFVPVDEDLMDKLIQVVQTNFSDDVEDFEDAE